MNGYSQYRTQAATTASPAQLVLMLYNGALAEITRAERGLIRERIDTEDVHDSLARAQAIVSELLVTLDYERGGEMAGNLASLYTFCIERLIDANIAKSAEGLAAVTNVLTDLRDAWEQACCGTAAVAG